MAFFITEATEYQGNQINLPYTYFNAIRDFVLLFENNTFKNDQFANC